MLLQLPQPISPPAMHLFLEQHRVADEIELLVPSMVDEELRIKIVTTETFAELQAKRQCAHISHGSKHFLFGYESRSLVETPGIIVSVWKKSPLIASPAINYSYAKALLQVHGNGFGKRHRSDCIGMNLYCNKRETSRPNPSPLVSENFIKEHQYWRQTQKYPLIQPMLEKRLHELTTNAQQLFRQVNSPLFDMFGYSCNKQIVTTGRLPQKKRFSTLAFVNTCHVDTCDTIRDQQHQDLVHLLEKSNDDHLTKEYKKKVLAFKGFCLPTTIGYQFVNNGEQSGQVEQYFSLEGLGLAVEIQHGIGHHFLGAAFAHRTCLCFLLDTERNIQLSNCYNNCLVFAWGRSGGANDHERACNNAN